MTGSSRIVDHTTFSELQWRRDPFSPDNFILQPGFQALSHLLEEEFVEVLKDIHALQYIRDSGVYGDEEEGVMTIAHIDNHQASIQSRLVNLSGDYIISECCHLAAYLCSTMLRCKLWRASTVPVSEVHRLLFHHSIAISCRVVLTLTAIVPPVITVALQITTSRRRYLLGLSA
jgi:hypothetical protein